MSQSYRAICFDLDGTLLPFDVDDFMKAYFRSVSAYVARFGIAPDQLLRGIKEGTKAMVMREDGRANAEVFWERFSELVPGGDVDWKQEFSRYYESNFNEVGKEVVADPAAARGIAALVDRGYPLVLTTMPMFPRRAVEWRLEWSGVDPDVFSRITTYENSTSVKPKLAYYAENLAAMGLSGSEVLMVGNNTKEDIAFRDLGADIFLVTDYLLDPVNFDIDSVRHGSLEEFACWAEALPVCENPIEGIKSGLIEQADRQAYLAANIKEGATIHSVEEFVLNEEKE